jgi:hypothetical protein
LFEKETAEKPGLKDGYFMNELFKVNDSLLRAANYLLTEGELVVHLVNDIPHSSSAGLMNDVAHTSLPAHRSHKRLQRTNERS